MNRVIAIFGPDGSGKSTILNELYRICQSNDISIRKYHWRPGILPYKHRNIFKLGKHKNFELPHRTKQRHFIKSFFILLYIYFDFLIGILINTFLDKKINNIIFYERFFYDILVDERRYGIGLPFEIRYFFARIIPKPKIIILLDANASIINSRKNELSIEEIGRQRILYKEILGKFAKIDVFDVEISTPEEISATIYSNYIKNLVSHL